MRTGLRALAPLACLLMCNCFLLETLEGPEQECELCDDDGPEPSLVPFELDPTCELDGELTVEIGQGDYGFVAIEDGEQPVLHSAGGFQGGVSHHYFVSVRVGNVDLDRYEQLEIVVTSYDHGECPDDGAPCDNNGRGFQTIGEYEPWQLVDGAAQEVGIWVPYAAQVTTQVEVRDPCGQEGWAQHRW